jgi:hypothetical protein
MRTILRPGLLAVALGLVAFGCQSEPPKGAVSGKVTFDGKPAPGGFITFQPKTGGVPVTASIAEDGSYHAPDVLAGECMVSIESPPPDGEAAGQIIKEMGKAPRNSAPAAPAAKKPIYPDRYAKFDTSKLTVTVKPIKEGTTTFDAAMTK